MDIATVIGIVGGFVLIIISILLGSPISSFINIPGLLIVVGGTIMATLIMQKLNVVLGAIQVAFKAFFDKSAPPDVIIKQIISLAEKSRKQGLLALEDEKIENPYLSKGIKMAVDGMEPEEIIMTLQIEINSLVQRHEAGHNIFKFMGASAPAMGMIGTLIGLVQMLRTMSDPSTIGPSMAVALLTTFYGAVLAFLVFNPIAENLAGKTDQEKIVMNIILNGMDGIVKGLNQSLLQDKLTSFLSPKKRNLR